MLEGSTLSLLSLACVRHHSNGRGLFSHLHKSTPTLFLNGRPNRLCVARDERHRSDTRRPFGTLNGLPLHVTIGLVSGFLGSLRAMLVSQSPQSNLPIPPIPC